MAFLQEPTFWVLVAFIIFLGATARPLGRLITGGLDKRADKISADLEEAEVLRKEAQDLLASYQRKQRDALQEAEDILQHAREESERIATQGKENLEASLERRRKLAIERIEQAEAQALDTVRAKTVDLALDATREFLAKELKGKQADALIDNAINDLPGKLH
ncbi:MAG: F0F1 ATP synthase subunit B [Alphaproteobacteria bacterium]|jgi:F-type H+-transporting ATPase subunit b|nr:F0F1 ATP synthase subunit B [Alphaproteobacteria bacterium]MBT7942034.1 F0F1 ATP synthase subunit B [Alphaproteobacteria bacterium]